MERLKPQAAAAQDARQGIERKIATVERDLARLTAAVTAGGELDTLVSAIKEREKSREALRLELRTIERAHDGDDPHVGTGESARTPRCSA